MGVDMIFILENWKYETFFGFKDSFVPKGDVYGHPNYKDGTRIHVSRPRFLEKENMILTTRSHSKYKLGVCGGDIKEELNYIYDDMNKL